METGQLLSRYPDILLCLHWLRVHERIEFKIVVLKSSTDLRRGISALSHVSPTYPVDDRCVLSAVSTNRLVVHTSRLSTVGSRDFPVAGPHTCIWNDFPEDVTSAESLTIFRRLLKTHLFMKSFPDYLLDIN